MPPTIEAYLVRLANTTVGPSTLRNQGAAGVTAVAREFLGALDLGRFVQETEAAFRNQLDASTEILIASLPKGAQNWGTARKALNLYLGECYYHLIVSTHFQLDRILPFLEVPLDSQVAGFLRRKGRRAGPKAPPSWPGIRSLNASVSDKYQGFASGFAASLGAGWFRLHIDLIAWQRQ